MIGARVAGGPSTVTEIYRFTPGDTPLLVSVPHAGTRVPDDLAARLSPAARALPDTDRHVDRLYDFAPAMGAATLVALQSRYVVDLNRDPSGRPLYPGADNTEVCPTATFDMEPVYAQGAGPPDADEVARRIEAYWRPYHDRLEAEISALGSRFGIAVLFDAHSIRSRVPRFFPGRLTDLNLGTASGGSADAELSGRLMDRLSAAPGYSSVLDGRFTGGYITRHYGRPADNVHAVQLEMAQCVYMDEAPPYAYRPDLAGGIRPTLRALLGDMISWAGTRCKAGR